MHGCRRSRVRTAEPIQVLSLEELAYRVDVMVKAWSGKARRGEVWLGVVWSGLFWFG
jgi:hypothetical protein